MAQERKYFGTDGVRGSVGDGPIRPDFVMKLGWAAGRILSKEGDGPIIIGKDTRISGYMFESALEAGLSAAGIDIRLLGPMPTPGIAYLTRTTRALGGIVISASHNPYYDNGIKFFSAKGLKLPDDVELEIEAELDKPIETVYSRHLGKAIRMADAGRRYIEFCKSKIDPTLNYNDIKVVLDCAHGAGYSVAPKIFEELGFNVITIGNEPDGLNINAECGATKPELLCEAVLEEQADVGVALDGDADRLILVDHKGEIVDGDEALFIISKARKEELNGAVVGTLMSNLGLEQAIRKMGLDFHRVNVGDRYILEKLLADDLKLGGESSGHIINLDMTTTGDGIISALQVMESMAANEHSLFDLKKGMNKCPQTMVNVRIQNKVNLADFPAIDKAVKHVEDELGDSGRVLLRPSGTEPLIRVMVEGDDAERISNYAKQLAEEVQTAVAN